MTSERNTARDYIDNAALYNAFVEWYAARDRAAQNGQPEPEPPTLIGEAILLIPQRLATKGNFCNYTYREEMVSDAVENLVRVYRNFQQVEEPVCLLHPDQLLRVPETHPHRETERLHQAQDDPEQHHS